MIYVCMSLITMTYYQYHIQLADKTSDLEIFVYLLVLLLAAILIILLHITIVKYRKKYKSNHIRNNYINNIVHDYKTPLTTISILCHDFNNIITNEFDINCKEKSKLIIEMLNKECMTLNIMTENILNVLQIEDFSLQTNDIVDVDDVINDCIMRMRYSVENLGGCIIEELNAEHTHIKGNYYLLLSIFLNLINNSIKYNDKTPIIKVNTFNADNMLNISIIDNGIGMTVEEMDKIFMKNYRVKKDVSKNGFGLGLFFVKDNIERLSGKIEVNSINGNGSEFRITLPIV